MQKEKRDEIEKEKKGVYVYAAFNDESACDEKGEKYGERSQ